MAASCKLCCCSSFLSRTSCLSSCTMLASIISTPRKDPAASPYSRVCRLIQSRNKQSILEKCVRDGHQHLCARAHDFLLWPLIECHEDDETSCTALATGYVMRKAGDSRVQVGCDCSEKCCHSPTSALIASSFASVSMRSLLFLSLLTWQNQPSRSVDPSFISETL